VETKGEVFGLVVRSRSLGATSRQVCVRWLGEIKEYTAMLEDTRRQAMDPEDARVCGSGYPTCWGVYEVGNLTRR